MPRILQAIVLMLLVGLAIFLVGPRPDTSYRITFDAAKLPADLDAYLADGEAAAGGVKADAMKEIVWAHPLQRDRTNISLVYLHGFSASKAEIEPVMQKVARRLGANLFLTRLAGHGMQDPAAMADATVNAWYNDVAEAIAIAERIGNRVYLAGTSTGGTLAALAAAEPSFAGKIAGVILISPNFAVQGASTGLLNMPWAEQLLPMVFGAERSFEPVNDRQAQAWTTRYPSQAVFPMGALLRIATSTDFAAVTVPVLAIFSEKDQVVVPAKTRSVLARWRGPVETMEISETGDPSSHVIAGDILSPQNNDAVIERMTRWIAGR